jgi:cytochrome c-type biogenesis protein CcmF
MDSLEAEGSIEGPVSREGMFLINNLLFVLFTFTVLIGTVFPLVVEAIRGKQMSVGRPYFDSMVVPIGTALVFLLGVGPALPWGRASREQVKRSLIPPFIGGLVVALIGFALGARNPWTVATLGFGGYAAWVTFAEMFLPVTQRMKRGENLGTAASQALLRRGRRRFGGYVVHAGAVVVIVAIAVSSTMRTQREVSLTRGQSATIGKYTVTFTGTEQRQEPNRTAQIVHVDVAKNGSRATRLEPRMNQYLAMREPVGTPAVYSTIAADLYVSIQNLDANGDNVGLLLLITPMVSWIWVAVLLMGLGGVIALIPMRQTYAMKTAPSPEVDGGEVAA